MALSTESVRNPGHYIIQKSTRNFLVGMVILGSICFGSGLALDSRRAWFAFVQDHFYFMSLALGGAFFAVIQWVTGAMWSAPIRRIAESFASYIPIALVTFLALCMGLTKIYTWADPAVVAHDLVISAKHGYLNVPFFIIRNIVVLGLLFLLSGKMIGNSIKQDTTRDYSLTLNNRTWSPAFLLLFGVGFTMAAFDQLMSLDPRWFSTMFGVYLFAGLFYSVLALLTILTVVLKRKGALEGIVNDNHLHDLGKFLFAFTIFWAYIGFSQFMLIWYANLPEETGYFLRRTTSGWLPVSVFLLVGKFLTPFFFLLPRDNKRSEKVLLRVGVFMLIAQWIDLLWIIQPELNASGPQVGWIEIGTLIGFIGMFGLAVSRFMEKNNLVAIGDPRLSESVHHHHQ